MANSGAPDRPRVQQVHIDAGGAGQRIDNFLCSRLKGVPRTRLYRSLRQGEVRVNHGRVRQDYRLQAGDVVRIPPLRTAGAGAAPTPAPAALARVADAVIHEDDELIVLDKPAGIAVHGGSGQSFGIIEALRALHPQAHFLELVHRLDRDTSGCLVVARKRSALTRLHALLREGRVRKCYLALLGGGWKGPERFQVAAPLRKNVLRSGERMVTVDHAAGKTAASRFHVLARARRATLVEVMPVTGRTHQIRVHAAHIGLPIAGDAKYGGQAPGGPWQAAGLRRLFLHCAEMAWQEPDGTSTTLRAPLPGELRQVLERLGIKRSCLPGDPPRNL